MTNPTPHGQVPEALRLANEFKLCNEYDSIPSITDIAKAEVELRRLHAYCQELESQVIRDCMTHVQKPAEIEHVAVDVSKNGAESNVSTQQPVAQQEAQEPCPTCAALARTVMLDQVSFDRKPDCYGIRQITDDEGVEEWEDIRTSPDVAREEADDMMATGRGEIYEVVPLWTTPQPAPAPLSEREAFEAWIKKDGGELGTFGTPPNMHYRNSAVNNAWVAWQARALYNAQGKPPTEGRSA